MVYHPERELGNHVPTVLPGRSEAFLFADETAALDRLHAEPGGGGAGELPETDPGAF